MVDIGNNIFNYGENSEWRLFLLSGKLISNTKVLDFTNRYTYNVSYAALRQHWLVGMVTIAILWMSRDYFVSVMFNNILF